MKDLFGQMREAQKQMKEIQNTLGTIRVSSETGGGMVEAIVDGEANLIDLNLDKDLIEKDDLKHLSKLIIKAVQNAQKKARKEATGQLQSFAGSLSSHLKNDS